MHNKIRAVTKADRDGLRNVVDSSQLFPSEYLDEMMRDFFHNPETQDFWFTYVEGSQPVSIGYCVPEKLTVGTYNLLAIGVAREFQGRGIATEMMAFIEQFLKQEGARILIVETSSDDAQIAARKLYQKIGYTQEAVLRDFWNEGEDKIVFWKKLNQGTAAR